MTLKKLLPILLLVVMAVAAISIRRCNNHQPTVTRRQPQSETRSSSTTSGPLASADKLDRTTINLFYTKHAKCRMKCRHITQQEVKDILVNGTINYNKSDLHDPRGPTYALEGITNDRQHVRIIFAPKQQHLTVVTVIDLENEFECNCT